MFNLNQIDVDKYVYYVIFIIYFGVVMLLNLIMFIICVQ